MNYTSIPDALILTYPWLKIAIYEESKFLFLDRPQVLTQWQQQALTMTEDEKSIQAPDGTMSQSFYALYTFFTKTIYQDKPITKHMIKEAIINYKDSIVSLVEPYFTSEHQAEESLNSQNQNAIDDTMNQDYIYSSMDSDYHLMRDIVTKKKGFKEKETGILGTEIVDNQGNVRGLAELRPNQLVESSAGQPKMWLNLLESTINSLDEMTADLFDLISYLWMVMPKDRNGYIEFHSDDALRLRYAEKQASGEELYFREKERFNIMKRVAALSSVWVSMGEDQIKVINTENLEENELYMFKDYTRMFEIGKIRVAFDKKTNEPKGIYALQIKPSSVLMPYLDGTKQSLGLLDLKVFQYSHFTQREHKRLTRYLNYQWKIRALKRTIHQPFKVSTLLKTMDFSSRYNGVQVRDKFEHILDDLQQDGVIQNWHYSEPIDEQRVGKKGWFKDYWIQINVTILPPDFVAKENAKKINVSSIQRTEIYDIKQVDKPKTKLQPPAPVVIDQPVPQPVQVQASFTFHEPTDNIVLSPELMKQTIESLKLSIRKVAEEIGISHSTLSRYMRNKIKRQNKSNDQKMLQWLKANVQK
ncbi:helix-turn-helix domain-containing protein [Bacillus massiliigorillae]|uniref:helix-turn-helix domain-containing protein n=1 Tax=Bacillus massiliigorillae TaxID=1243664 RepID=UPI00039F26D6|nr:helix-turn-helix transcriptional regulator [Bacillus massiliigorillae]